jgi:hypothetical protein
MDIHISYWSPQFKKVIAIYIESVFLRHAEALKIKEVIEKFIEDKNLDPRMLLQCSMEGSTVE